MSFDDRLRDELRRAVEQTTRSTPRRHEHVKEARRGAIPADAVVVALEDVAVLPLPVPHPAHRGAVPRSLIAGAASPFPRSRHAHDRPGRATAPSKPETENTDGRSMIAACRPSPRGRRDDQLGQLPRPVLVGRNSRYRAHHDRVPALRQRGPPTGPTGMCPTRTTARRDASRRAEPQRDHDRGRDRKRESVRHGRRVEREQLRQRHRAGRRHQLLGDHRRATSRRSRPTAAPISSFAVSSSRPSGRAKARRR